MSRVSRIVTAVNWRYAVGEVLLIVVGILIALAVADWNEVPTGSMKPTILEGDRILVNKMALTSVFPSRISP